MLSSLAYFRDLYISKAMHATRSGQVYSHQSLIGKGSTGDGGSDDGSDHSTSPGNGNEDEEQDIEGRERAPQEFNVFSEDGESEDDDDDDDDDKGNEGNEPHTVLAVDHCRLVGSGGQSREESNPYFAFQLGVAEVETVGIRIGSLRRGGEEKCSECGIQSCIHIIRLKSAMGISPGDDCYQRLEERGMSNVCDELGWDFSDESYLFPAPQWSLKNETLRRSITSRGRDGEAMDILSFFQPQAVADEYRDIFEFAVHNDDVLVSYNLEATLPRLLTQDDVIFRRFEQHIPKERRDILYLHKMEDKFNESLRQLDEYSASGALSNWNALAPPGSIRFEHDIPCRYEQAQSVASSSNPDPNVEAVRSRNVDVYPNHSFRRNRPHGEQLTNRNLYLNLLGPRSEDVLGRSGFILDSLEILPGNVVSTSDFVDRLDRLHADLSSVAFVSPRRLYMNRLGQLISKLRASYGLSLVSASRQCHLQALFLSISIPPTVLDRALPLMLLQVCHLSEDLTLLLVLDEAPLLVQHQESGLEGLQGQLVLRIDEENGQ
ncbi:hypothetical protein DSL72_004631 [Monilinia vaccinii-corymbosi]|uniref:Uncharacterized protein n=1 Tax=Monilinia vaccinii-corymbosi TaxID=61207 RepID=A0A8A3P507_9HELO|nr:hypothetical protein DSL72_004631 [Monilinia vaccinii-corymbosi]